MPHLTPPRDEFQQQSAIQTKFDIRFALNLAQDLLVSIDDQPISPSDYILHKDANQPEGLTVFNFIEFLTPPPLNSIIVLQRLVDPLNLPSFDNISAITSDGLNAGFTGLSQAVLDRYGEMKKTIHFPLYESEIYGQLPQKDKRKSRLIGFDENGKLSLYSPTSISVYAPEPVLPPEPSDLTPPISEVSIPPETVETQPFIDRQARDGVALNGFRLSVLEGASLLDLGAGISDDFVADDGLAPPPSAMNPAPFSNCQTQSHNQDTPQTDSFPLDYLSSALPLEITLNYESAITPSYYSIGGLSPLKAKPLSWLVEAKDANDNWQLIDQQTGYTSWSQGEANWEASFLLPPLPAPINSIRLTILESDHSDLSLYIGRFDCYDHNWAQDGTMNFRQDEQAGALISLPRQKQIALNQNDVNVVYGPNPVFENGDIRWSYQSHAAIHDCFHSYLAVTGHGDFKAEFIWQPHNHWAVYSYGFFDDLDLPDWGMGELGIKNGKDVFGIYYGDQNSQIAAFNAVDPAGIIPITPTLADNKPFKDGQTIHMERLNGYWYFYYDGKLVYQSTVFDDKNRYLVGTYYRQYNPVANQINLYQDDYNLLDVTLNSQNIRLEGDQVIGQTSYLTDSSDDYIEAPLNQPQQIYFCFDTPIRLNQIALRTKHAHGWFTMQYSLDNQNWQDCAKLHIKAVSTTAITHKLSWSPLELARYYRLIRQSENLTGNYHIYDVRLSQKLNLASQGRIMSPLSHEIYKADQPTDFARMVMLHKGPSLNDSHLKLYLSRDDGQNWVHATLSDVGSYGNGQSVLSAEAFFDDLPQGTAMRWRLDCRDSHKHELHAISLQWE